MGPRDCFFSRPPLSDELEVGVLIASCDAVTVSVTTIREAVVVGPKVRGTVIVKPEDVQPCCDIVPVLYTKRYL